METFESFIKDIESCYDEEGRPKHIHDPDNSAYCIMTYETYKKNTTREIMDVLRTKCIVVTGWPFERMEFDGDGLETVGPMDATISVQDLSVEASQQASNVMTHSTLDEVLKCAQDPKGKIVNTLDHPSRIYDPYEFATDDKAFVAARKNSDSVGRDQFLSIPVKDIRWYIAGLKGATHGWHFDSNGFVTVIDVRTGKKLWIVGFRKMQKGDEPFSDLNICASEEFHPFEGSKKHMETLEALLLDAGTRL